MGQRLRETSNEVARLQAQPCGERAQRTRAEERMELLAKDRDMHVAGQPRARDRAKSQLFHAFHDAAHGTLSLHEVNDGGAECFAG